MKYVGIDIHKRYSVCAAQDERGRQLCEARIEGNSASGFVQYLKALGGKSRVVIEACWNWGKIYDLLEEIDGVEEIVLAYPLKTRLIADAQIKTDKLDARALAMLLRGGFIARAHVPRAATRRRKELLRQRLYWSRMRTRLRNRVHALVDRQREIEFSPIFRVNVVRTFNHEARFADLSEPPAPAAAQGWLRQRTSRRFARRDLRTPNIGEDRNGSADCRSKLSEPLVRHDQKFTVQFVELRKSDYGD